MNEKYEQAKKLVAAYGQEHLLKFYDKLTKEDQEELLDQILSIDFDLMKKLYEDACKPLDLKDVTVEPIDYVDKSKLTDSEVKLYEEKGIEAIRSNKFAVVTSHKSLFELLCETLKRARDKYGVVIPWYIMTSRENNGATVDFFERNKYFGYPKDSVKFFIQGELPMIGIDGKILLDESLKVKQAADGHGGR